MLGLEGGGGDSVNVRRCTYLGMPLIMACSLPTRPGLRCRLATADYKEELKNGWIPLGRVPKLVAGCCLKLALV